MGEYFKLDFVHPNRQYGPVKYLSNKSVSFIKHIGGGTYGDVYLGEMNNFNVAIKRNAIEENINMMGSIRELDILNKCKHPFIVDLMAIFLSNPFKNFEMPPIMQFETKDGMVDRDKPIKVIATDLKEDPLFFGFEAASYDFQSFIHDCENKSWSYIKKAMVQLLIAMKWLKAKGIIHRDLKPSNLLWQKDGSERFLKICDFGMSKHMYETGVRSPRVVTSWYRAPEICFGYPYSYPSDMWSVGCILYEIVTQRPLNFGIKDQSIDLLENSLCIISEPPTIESVTKINKLKLELNPKIYAPRRNIEEILNSKANNNLTDYYFNFDKDGLGTKKQFADLLNHILVLDPQTRYTPEQCLEHPFFYYFRNYVKQIETLYPPIPPVYEPINIVNCKDRKIAAHICCKIFDDEDKFPWYKPQIIFHTLEIYDKYLTYMQRNNSGFHEKGATLEESRYEPEKTSTFKILVCLYICVKYFTVTKVAGSFMDILAEKFHTTEYMKFAKDFESGLIIHLLNCQIYRPTILEASDDYRMIPNKANIKYMLMYYCSLKTGVYTNYKELFPGYLNFQAQKLEEKRLRLFMEEQNSKVEAVSAANNVPANNVPANNVPANNVPVNNVPANNVPANGQQFYSPNQFPNQQSYFPVNGQQVYLPNQFVNQQSYVPVNGQQIYPPMMNYNQQGYNGNFNNSTNPGNPSNPNNPIFQPVYQFNNSMSSNYMNPTPVVPPVQQSQFSSSVPPTYMNPGPVSFPVQSIQNSSVPTAPIVQPSYSTVNPNLLNQGTISSESFTPIAGIKENKILSIPKNPSSLKERQISVSLRPKISIIHTTQNRYVDKSINPNISPSTGEGLNVEEISDTDKIISDGTMSPLINSFGSMNTGIPGMNNISKSVEFSKEVDFPKG